MPETLVLALDFLDEHPEAAVRTLEQHDTAKVAEFLQRIPETHAVLVLREALPSFVARLCRNLSPDTAARLMLELPVTRMVAILRHLDHVATDAILRECPQSRRQACNLLLRYGKDRVGAWMVPITAVVAEGFTCGEVLAYLRDATEETASKYVFIVNRQGVPKGRVSYLRLLRVEPATVAATLMETPVPVLSAQLSLQQALHLSCWEDVDVVPVVGAQHQFLGVLRHLDLRKGLRQDEGLERGQAAGVDPLLGLVDVYGKSLLALFDTVSSGGAQAQGGRRREDGR